MQKAEKKLADTVSKAEDKIAQAQLKAATETDPKKLTIAQEKLERAIADGEADIAKAQQKLDDNLLKDTAKMLKNVQKAADDIIHDIEKSIDKDKPIPEATLALMIADYTTAVSLGIVPSETDIELLLGLASTTPELSAALDELIQVLQDSGNILAITSDGEEADGARYSVEGKAAYIGNGGLLTIERVDGDDFIIQSALVGGESYVGFLLVYATGFNDGATVFDQEVFFDTRYYYNTYTTIEGSSSPVDKVTFLEDESYETFVDNVKILETATWTENVVLDIDVLGNDTDLDTPITTLASATSAFGASVTVNVDGTIHYDSNGAAGADALGVGIAGTDTFTYTVTNANNTQSTATVSVELTGENDAPETHHTSTTGNDYSSIAVTLSGSDDDMVAGFKFPGVVGVYSDIDLTQRITNSIVTASGNEATVYFDPQAAYTSNERATIPYVAIDEYGVEDASYAWATVNIIRSFTLVTHHVSASTVDPLVATFGIDTFVFAADSGQHTIEDFDLGQDFIDVAGFGIAGIGEVTINDNGTDTFVDFGAGNDLALVNVIGLTADAFLFLEG